MGRSTAAGNVHTVRLASGSRDHGRPADSSPAGSSPTGVVGRAYARRAVGVVRRGAAGIG
jgi:hypothetical protein